MKIVNLIGGLGNQMFQYAFAVALKEQISSEDVLIDTSHFNYIFLKKYKAANIHNGYEIEKVFPNAKLNHAKWWQLIRVTWYCPNFLLSRVVKKVFPHRNSEYIQPVSDYFKYESNVYGLKGKKYYDGQWSSIKYYLPIRNKLLEVFTHPQASGVNMEYIQKMEQTDSVGVHIRRGDYLQDPDFRNICELDYYKRAIKRLEEESKDYTFFIFSNDIQWCKKNISPLLSNYQVQFVTENHGSDSCWDMHLMTHCKNLIIANSSFSWWGAFLNNRGGLIIAPEKWVNRDSVFDIWDDKWVKL